MEINLTHCNLNKKKPQTFNLLRFETLLDGTLNFKKKSRDRLISTLINGTYDDDPFLNASPHPCDVRVHEPSKSIPAVQSAFFFFFV